MTARPILPWPDRRLQSGASQVEAITDEIRAIWQDMIDTMEAMPGVGLAAPQIGVMLRLAVVDASDARGQAIRLANPVVLDTSREMRAHDEASPNLPGVSARLERPAQVTVQFLNDRGQVDRRAFEGLWSTSVQHQIDHLNGMIFADRLSPVKRGMLLKKAEKLRRRG